MPILATLTVASLLFGGADEKTSLLSPTSLREKLNDALEDSDLQVQRDAMALLDHLQESVSDYNETVESVLDKFSENAKQNGASPLAISFSASDALRKAVFDEVIQVRRQLLELLGPDKWRALFED